VFVECEGYSVTLCSPACAQLWSDLQAGRARDHAQAWLRVEDREDWEERAALLEYEGRLPRAKAEAQALAAVWREVTKRKQEAR
jgi:hypothetical protein